MIAMSASMKPTPWWLMMALPMVCPSQPQPALTGNTHLALLSIFGGLEESTLSDTDGTGGNERTSNIESLHGGCRSAIWIRTSLTLESLADSTDDVVLADGHILECNHTSVRSTLACEMSGQSAQWHQPMLISFLPTVIPGVSASTTNPVMPLAPAAGSEAARTN